MNVYFKNLVVRPLHVVCSEKLNTQWILPIQHEAIQDLMLSIP